MEIINNSPLKFVQSMLGTMVTPIIVEEVVGAIEVAVCDPVRSEYSYNINRGKVGLEVRPLPLTPLNLHSQIFIASNKREPIDIHQKIRDLYLAQISKRKAVRSNLGSAMVKRMVSVVHQDFKNDIFEKLKESLTLMHFHFDKYKVSMLAWNTQPDNHLLYKINLADPYKYEGDDFLNYVGLHFSFLQMEEYKDYLVEKDFNGVKFFSINLHSRNSSPKSDGFNKLRSIIHKENLDNEVYVNYCSVDLNTIASSHKGLLPQSIVIQERNSVTEENTLTEKDQLKIRMNILRYLIDNGLSMARKKHIDPYSASILSEYQEFNVEELREAQFDISDKIITLSYYS